MAETPLSSGEPDGALFDHWCEVTESKSGEHSIYRLEENESGRVTAIQVLRQLIPVHYSSPELLEARLRRLGWEKSAEALRSLYPQSPRARSGDLGEILATEYVNHKMKYRVPIYRLRWKDGRELALRGDDIIAIRIDENSAVHFLKGEAKSRQVMSTTVIEEALDALARNAGRPSAHSLNFVVARLLDLGDPLWEQLDEFVTSTEIPARRVTHFLFTLSGNDPLNLTARAIAASPPSSTCAFVSVIVNDHARLVASAFEAD